MCGIFGIISASPETQIAPILDAMRAALVHRGPDGSGRLVLSAGRDRSIGIGHVRLSIVAPDAVSAAQPMSDRSGRYVMSFNGEIYNYPELMEELAAKGHRFAAASDSEALLAAYAEWGAACLPRLRGMFAVAIWDRERHRLFLARDANGKKPLWLRRLGDGVAFASEIQALTAPVGRPVSLADDLDPSAVADCLVYKYVPRNRSLVRGIYELPPGTWAEIDGTAHTPAIEPSVWYEHPKRRHPGRRRLSRADIDDFRVTLDEAVRIRLRADVPLGLFLSGGLDSSSMLAMASRHRDAPFETFCVAFEGTEERYSEAWAAERVARHFGTSHHVLTLDPTRFAAALEAATWHRGAPLGEIADVALFELSKLARDRVKTVLSGEGADELLAGYPRYWGEVWARRWHALLPPAADALPGWAARALPYRARRVAILARATAERDFDTRQAGWFGALSPGDLARLAPDLARTEAPRAPVSPAGRDTAIQAAMAFDKAVWLPGNILARGDRMTMAAGLEMRMPFMDTVLADHAARLPEDAFVRGRTGKRILRRAMTGLLPPEIAERPKHGFRVPFHEWCRGALRPVIEERLLDGSAESRAFIPRAGLERMIGEHMRRQRNHEKALWALLGLEIHLRQLAAPRAAAPALSRTG